MKLEPLTTKNDEGRSFPFSMLPALEAVLHAQREFTSAVERATDRVIPHVFHRDGEPIRALRGAWKTACRGAGCPGRLVHDFRRTAVRNLERAGVSRSVAMKLTGHMTERVFRRYAIVSEADLGEGVAKLARLHGAQGAQRQDYDLALTRYDTPFIIEALAPGHSSNHRFPPLIPSTIEPTFQGRNGGM